MKHSIEISSRLNKNIILRLKGYALISFSLTEDFVAAHVGGVFKVGFWEVAC